MKQLAKYLLTLICSFAALSCSESEAESSAEATLTLSPSASFIVVSTSSSVEFTVMYGSKDITSNSDVMIYQKTTSGSERLDTNSFVVSRAGTYTFYAIYGNYMSEEISVTGITNLPDAAPDAYPDKYDSFHKRVLGTLGTGTWCSNCPTLMSPIHDFLETTDDFVMSEAHYGDIMDCTASSSVISLLGISGFPTLYLSMSSSSANTINNGSTTAVINKAVSEKLAVAAKTGISVNTSYDGSVVCVRADVKVGETGQYRIGALLVEDDVYALQTNATEDWMNYHEAAICGSYPTSFSLTQTLDSSATQQAGTDHMFYCEFNFSTLYTVVTRDNCRVIVYTVNNTLGEVDNVVQLPIGESLSFEYDL